MIWQDAVFSVGSIVFAIALVPATLHKDKPPLTTSIPTALVLGIFGLTYTTLNLWYSAATTAMTCLLWTILLVQKLRQSTPDN
jgi:hypothetical protein